MSSSVSRTQRRTHPRRAQRSTSSRIVKRYSAQEIEKFRAMILMLRNETIGEVDSLKESIEASDTDHSVHSLHDATSRDHLSDANVYEYGRELGLIRELDAALERIEKREYGLCRKCGSLIEKMRLLLSPMHACVFDAKTVKKTRLALRVDNE